MCCGEFLTFVSCGQIFEPFGPVELVQLPLDLETGHCKGFGFVQVSEKFVYIPHVASASWALLCNWFSLHWQFAQVEHSKAAQSLNGKIEIAGRYIKVGFCHWIWILWIRVVTFFVHNVPYLNYYFYRFPNIYLVTAGFICHWTCWWTRYWNNCSRLRWWWWGWFGELYMFFFHPNVIHLFLCYLSQVMIYTRSCFSC